MSVEAEDIEDEEIDVDAGGDEDVDQDGDGEFEDDDEPGGLSEVEQIAVDAGWKPKDQWKGPGWKPAAEFLKGGVKAARDAKRESRDLSERIDALANTQQITLDRQREQLVARAEELKAQAIEKGGKDAVETVKAIDKVLAEETAKLKADAEPAAMELTPLDEAYLADHSWMFSDETLDGDKGDIAEADKAFKLYTDMVASILKKTGDANDAHERAGKAVRKAFAHRYDEEEERPTPGKKPGRRTPELAGGHTSARGGGGGPDISKLPPEAKAAMTDAVRRGIFASNAEWLDVYNEEKQKGRRR